MPKHRHTIGSIQWKKLDDFHHLVMSKRLLDDAWQTAASNDTEAAERILDELGYEFAPNEKVVAFEMNIKPDDILGEYYEGRVRVRKTRSR